MSNAADDDLEALFDSIAGAGIPQPVAVPVTSAAAATVSEPSSGDLYTQVGQATKKLHDALREIGHDRFSSLSEKLRGVSDVIKPTQDSLENGANQLSTKWQSLLDGKLSVDEFKVLAGETKSYLQDVPSKTKPTSAKLTELPDPQSIKKLTEAVQGLEGQLVQLLIANAPEAKKKELNGASSSTPDQVKALLGTRGF